MLHSKKVESKNFAHNGACQPPTSLPDNQYGRVDTCYEKLEILPIISELALRKKRLQQDEYERALIEDARYCRFAVSPDWPLALPVFARSALMKQEELSMSDVDCQAMIAASQYPSECSATDSASPRHSTGPPQQSGQISAGPYSKKQSPLPSDEQQREWPVTVCATQETRQTQRKVAMRKERGRGPAMRDAKPGRKGHKRLFKKPQRMTKPAETRVDPDIESCFLKEIYWNQETGRPKQMLTCTICRMQTVRLSNMYDHLRSHLGIKPFKCPFCGEGFA